MENSLKVSPELEHEQYSIMKRVDKKTVVQLQGNIIWQPRHMYAFWQYNMKCIKWASNDYMPFDKVKKI